MKDLNKYALILVLALFLSHPAFIYSQISQGGTPKSFNPEIPDIQVPEYEFTKPDLKSIKSQDVINDSLGLPLRYAVKVPVGLNMTNIGVWTELQEGGQLWQASLKVSDAIALGVYFNEFHLPDGSELFLYNESRTQVLGAYTHLNNPESGEFAIELVQGELVTLEYYEPEWVSEPAVMDISGLSYAYRAVSFTYGNGNQDGFGDSWYCHINVNCSPQGDNWQDEKRGAARISIKIGSNYYWCSGSLINNTNVDGTPYFLTAAHCGDGASASDRNYWVFYFNYEASGCSNPSQEPSSNTITGCTLRAEDPSAGNTGADFALVELNSNVPLYYNPYYNGWNRASGSSSGAGIHHPSGDIKKISLYTSAIQTTTAWNGMQTHWLVNWSEGIIQGGSSGSPLFDNNGRIVGDLTGHYTYSSCTNPSPAFYGKFSYAWDQNGSTSSTQLEPWLDPGNTGVYYLDGYDPNVPVLPDCATLVSPSNGGTNISVSTSLQWNTANNATGYDIYFGTDNPPTNIENGTNLGNVTSYSPSGDLDYNETYYWKIVPYNNDGSATGCSTWSFTTEQGVPSCTTPVNPGNGSTGNSIFTSLEWNTEPDATGYYVYFGTDNPPTNIENGSDVGNTTTFSPATPLNYNETYYWKIIPYNSYGQATGCSVWNFFTGSQDPCLVTTLPFSENFDAVTPPAMPNCWSIETNNYEWKTSNLDPYSSPNSLFILKSGGGAFDDWAFSPPIRLEESRTYQITFRYKGGFSSYTDDLEVKYGTEASSSGMTSGTIFSDLGFIYSNYQQATATFSPSSTNDYYLGFHAMSSNGYYQLIDDILLEDITPDYSGYWIGGTSGSETDWSVADNWYGSTLPDNTTDVTIPSNPSSGYFPEAISSSPAESANLTIHPGGRLTVPVGKILAVNGSIHLQSNSTASASLIDNGSVLYGSANVDLYLSENQWHYLSPPVSDAYSGVFTDIYLKHFQESDSTWYYIVPQNVSLDAGRGYAAWASSALTGSTTVSYSGTLNNGDINLPITATDQNNNSSVDAGEGWNVLGNPYPSAVAMNGNWTGSGIGLTFYVYDGTQYLTWNIFTQSGTKPNNILPPMQGFVVKATGLNPSLTIPQSQRLHHGEQFYKSEKMTDLSLIRLFVEGKYHSDQTIVGFHKDANVQFDPKFDGYKLRGNSEAPQLYTTTVQGQELAVNILPEPQKAMTVEMAFETTISGNYVLSAGSLEEIDPQTQIILEDKYNPVAVDLSKVSSYEFVYQAGDPADRFRLHFIGKNEGPNTGNTEKWDLSIYAADKNICVASTQAVNGTIIISDLTGKTIIEKELANKALNLIPVNAKSGIYIYKVINHDQVFSGKVYLR